MCVRVCLVSCAGVVCVWLHRLNLMANALRSEGVWHAFSAGTPSLANLQFTCQTLVLSLNELTQVPVEVCRLVNLRHLYVSFNRLTSLPPLPSSLVVLAAGRNDLRRFEPVVICEDDGADDDAKKNEDEQRAKRSERTKEMRR